MWCDTHATNKSSLYRRLQVLQVAKQILLKLQAELEVLEKVLSKRILNLKVIVAA